MVNHITKRVTHTYLDTNNVPTLAVIVQLCKCICTQV